MAMLKKIDMMEATRLTREGRLQEAVELLLGASVGLSAFDANVHERPLDDIILQDAKDAITEQAPISLSYKVRTLNRSVGTKVSGEIGRTNIPSPAQPSFAALEEALSKAPEAA